jgi:hypothetical protein
MAGLLSGKSLTGLVRKTVKEHQTFSHIKGFSKSAVQI